MTARLMIVGGGFLVVMAALFHAAEVMAQAPDGRRVLCVQGWEPRRGNVTYTPNYRIMACTPLQLQRRRPADTRTPEKSPDVASDRRDIATPHTDEAVADQIDRVCTERWPDDLVVREACKDRQWDAYRRVR